MTRFVVCIFITKKNSRRTLFSIINKFIYLVVIEYIILYLVFNEFRLFNLATETLLY